MVNVALSIVFSIGPSENDASACGAARRPGPGGWATAANPQPLPQ